MDSIVSIRGCNLGQLLQLSLSQATASVLINFYEVNIHGRLRRRREADGEEETVKEGTVLQMSEATTGKV